MFFFSLRSFRARSARKKKKKIERLYTSLRKNRFIKSLPHVNALSLSPPRSQYQLNWTNGIGDINCSCNWLKYFTTLGADHFTLEGLGGWWVILKKISCKRLSEEKNCMQHKCNRKLMGKKGKKYPAHQIARKKFLMPEIAHPTPQELNGRPLTHRIKQQWHSESRVVSLSSAEAYFVLFL